MTPSRRNDDLRSAVRLCRFTIAWNVLAGVGAVAFALVSHSLALAGFGLNAAVDSIASATLVWRFNAEMRDVSRNTETERLAVRVVGVVLLAIATYVALRSVISLVAGSSPDRSIGGLVVAAASVFVLSPLAYGKSRLAQRLESKALHGDSVLSTVGAVLAVIAIVVTGLSSSWWWLDAVGAFLMSVILCHEGILALRHGVGS